ncbi:MAG: antitoxin HicB [Actinomycetaceae bacterium]|nr:antitoxin HicB [Arcanobacterium sp.]MDD7505569.1 antitoxin HicB [Actinomycetaceae bacterium]MDY6143812.1 antitoxin HicB [Arcanobacterium sp.]
MTTHITVKATRWARGWELEIDNDEYTQVRRLSAARQQVIDYLDTTHPETDHSDWHITIIPSLDEFTAQVEEAKRATQEAAEAQAAAAAKTRATVRSLLDAGISSTDAAIIMGVSKGRISQLARA